MIEFDVEFPNDSYLDVEVWDYDAVSADDMIGSTRIDLENRFFSPHRPRCGLQQKYEMYGTVRYCIAICLTIRSLLMD